MNNTEAYQLEARRENLRAVRRGHDLTVRELMNDKTPRGKILRDAAGLEEPFEFKPSNTKGLVSLANLL